MKNYYSIQTSFLNLQITLGKSLMAALSCLLWIYFLRVWPFAPKPFFSDWSCKKRDWCERLSCHGASSGKTACACVGMCACVQVYMGVYVCVHWKLIDQTAVKTFTCSFERAIKHVCITEMYVFCKDVYYKECNKRFWLTFR